MTTLPPRTHQRLLSIKAEVLLPTVDLAGARSILDLREDQIKDLVTVTKEIPAWNIARPKSKRREWRLLTRAVRNYANSQSSSSSFSSVDEDFIVRLLYGAERVAVWGSDFIRSWNCDSGTMINLLKDGVLKTAANATPWHRGPKGTPAIAWSSAIAFLKSRRIKL